MDRNATALLVYLALIVALRKESVDRNKVRIAPINSVSSVALRKESVDRNTAQTARNTSIAGSLSARRAWIEIKRRTYHKDENLSRSPQGERG